MEPNNSGSNSTNYGMEKLVGTNYNYWRLCMEAYLQGQDLWDLVDSADSDIPNDTPENAEPRRKWKIKCGKALFALRTSISKEHIDHIRDVNSPKEVWRTLERLFTKKNTARLQLLENELAGLMQGGMSISDYFLKIKNICSEISELDVDEPVSEARLRRYLIRGLRKEYMPFVTSVQGWASQPSVEELENLLSNQEALAKQMSLQTESNDVLFSKENSKSKHFSEAIGGSKNVGESSHSEKNNQLRWKNVRCYRCRQLGHVKRMCRVKLVDENANMVTDEASDQPKWEQCFSSVVAEALANTSATFSAPVNYEKEWIIDSGCSHHVTGNDSLFSELHQHSGDKVIITADNSVHPVEKEGNVCIASERLKEDDIVLSNVYHVPGLRKNLVSVSQITNSGKYVLFGPEDVKILDNVKNIGADVLVVGEKRDSLFVMSAVEAYVEKTSRNDGASIWHARLGHVGYQMLQQISSKKLVDGIPVIKDPPKGVVCQGCQYGKSHILPFKKSSNRKKISFELVHADLMGPTRTLSYSGFRYMMVIVDDFSRYSWVYFLNEKNEAFSKFLEFESTIKREFGSKIRCLRTDNGGEFMSSEFLQHCEAEGINRQMTCPKTPQQNGVVERKIGHMSQVSLSWLHAKNLPRELWAEAMRCACHVINRLPPWLGIKSPFELLYNVKPDVSHLRVFGSICFVHVSKSDRTKLDPKSKKCLFIGYDLNRKGWRCMDPVTKRCITSRNVVFDEVSLYYSPQKLVTEVVDSDFELTEKGVDSTNRELSSQNVECSTHQDDFRARGSTQNSEGILNSSTLENDNEVRCALRRSAREKRHPSYLKDYEVQVNQSTVSSCFFLGAVDNSEPSCYEAAKGIPEWEAAMEEETNALLRNDTWELVPKPKDVEPVTCKWVYKVKKKADGTVNRFKARLVARGFSQHYGMDYEETFSPVAKMVTVRTIISLAAYKGWKLWQLDVKNAFLYGELDRAVFMEQPQGFVSKQFPHYVCLLKKALYGLKQAPRAWYGKIAQYLTFCGFKVSDSDSSMFVKLESGKHVIVLLYVDDMIITGDDNVGISCLRNDLSIRFEMKILGEIGCFLGLEVQKLEDGYFVSQKGYAQSLLERFNMGESKSMSTPMEPNMKLKKDEGKLLEEGRKFRQLVGSLIYLTITRPEIAYSVGVVSQFMDKPQISHLNAAKRILRYVKGTLEYGLRYKKSDSFILSGFVDADWAGDVNDRRSTTGYCFDTGSAAISWCSKKQHNVTLSSTEAEYAAATMATQECVWLKRLINDIYAKVDYVIPIHCDNESAIKLAENPVFHARTKHIEVQHHFVREKVLEQEIALEKVRTGDQVADIFTKALTKEKFEMFRDALGVIDCKHALRESVKISASY
ncbi:hypothetical protein RJ639_016441 [Escallonia herrerae]|uniref:Polyprotein n=1 Tax=Escallonia herrerae TaxID=1293975 RepID=A0AA88VDJ7_9ASTE|nr:hypothetical protein RJ639_016441 [Escallonia herrerae]